MVPKVFLRRMKRPACLAAADALAARGEVLEAIDMLTAATLQNDRFDACAMQQPGQEQTCRPGADDADLRALRHPHSSSWKAA